PVVEQPVEPVIEEQAESVAALSAGLVDAGEISFFAALLPAVMGLLDATLWRPMLRKLVSPMKWWLQRNWSWRLPHLAF
ncbi:hypothetical protein, partial [Halomonas sp. ND22Bw]|uniref:hypothetical protein n=1 Tax=Halomonas sp. ND22Bw TaxID=2054178 RepID=UPI001C62B3D0